jgi:hypothetical protein
MAMRSTLLFKPRIRSQSSTEIFLYYHVSECGLLLFFKVLFMLKYIKIIFLIFKKLFLRLSNQNNLKYIYIKLTFSKKKIKFFLETRVDLHFQTDS